MSTHVSQNPYSGKHGKARVSSASVQEDGGAASSSSASSECVRAPARKHKRPAKKPIHVENTSDEDNKQHPIPRKSPRAAHGERDNSRSATDTHADDRSDPAPARARRRRFDWSRGEGLKARGYLQSRFDEWANCADQRTRNAITEEAEEYVVMHYVFRRHNSGDVRKAVRIWFKNAQGRERNLSAAASRPMQPADVHADVPDHVALKVAQELNKVIKGRATSGSALWAKEHEATVRQRMQGTGIGERQRAVKECFSALPDEEQEAWRARAKHAAAASATKPNACFENQRLFTQLLARVLDQFPGFGPQNFGSIVMLTVGVPTDVDSRSYGTFEGGAALQEQDRWERFLGIALPPNPIRGDGRLIVTPEGGVQLPQVTNSWTRDDIVVILDSFFRLSWAQDRADDGNLQWPTVVARPEKFLNEPWLDVGIPEPSALSLVDAILLYRRLLEAQSSNTPFRFRPLDTLTARELPTGEGPSKLPRAPSQEMGDYLQPTRLKKVFPTPARPSPSSVRQSATRATTGGSLLSTVLEPQLLAVQDHISNGLVDVDTPTRPSTTARPQHKGSDQDDSGDEVMRKQGAEQPPDPTFSHVTELWHFHSMNDESDDEPGPSVKRTRARSSRGKDVEGADDEGNAGGNDEGADRGADEPGPSVKRTRARSSRGKDVEGADDEGDDEGNAGGNDEGADRGADKPGPSVKRTRARSSRGKDVEGADDEGADEPGPSVKRTRARSSRGKDVEGADDEGDDEPGPSVKRARTRSTQANQDDGMNVNPDNVA
ncbi:hypothetical protein C2E23DRAFT_859798 [Lenzites betulinus]|nr:hypothetical protein C2E23DRAFT_859798 [Lenzites betulinus]